MSLQNRSYMSYGLNLGWGGPIGDYIGFWGGPIKEYTTNLVQGSHEVPLSSEGKEPLREQPQLSEVQGFGFGV